MIIAGWGGTENLTTSNKLLEADVKVIPNNACKEWHGYDFLKSFHLCTFTKGRRSHCGGDSGGPLVMQDLNNGGRYTQTAVASFGASKLSECGRKPGGFTRLTPEVLDWIEGISDPEAILITGGDSTDVSAELFLPWQNSTCELPPLPDRRYYHVQSGNTLCGGGYYSSTKRSCVQWSVQQGGWVTLPLNLTEDRAGSSVWRVSQDNSLVIMGGDDFGAKETSETVSSHGVSTRSSFYLKYPTSYACSIPLGDEVVITGGYVSGTTVSLYNKDGWVRDMPSLNAGRIGHGCTTYSTGGEQKVLLVTGGYGDNRLDSTEVLRPGSNWQEITSARLPRPLNEVRVITVNNRVLLFGGWAGDNYKGRRDILEYRDGDNWRKVGSMKNGRGYHALSRVNYNDFSDYCI